jgi:hypothetical protein
MNDPIEDALQRMKPAELPPGLMARLTAARPQADAAKGREEQEFPTRFGFLRRWLLPLGVCVAAAAGTVTWLNSTTGQRGAGQVAQPKAAAIPFESEDRFIGAREVGLIVPPGHRPIRLMEVEWLESSTVRPQPDGHALRVETTRRGVVPVAVEVF